MTNLSGLATEMEDERKGEGNRNPNGNNASDDFFSNLLEVAADDDVEALKGAVSRDPSAVDGPGRWLCRRRGSSRAALVERTPLMVAATYGSLDALSFLLSVSADPNRASSSDGATALHCAASGGADRALPAARLLLSAGADPNLLDHDGLRPADVLPSLPLSPTSRLVLEELLGGLRVSTSSSSSSSPPLSGSPSSDSTSTSSPPGVLTSSAAKKEYPVDPSLPDIKNSIYSTDEFRMYSFKVRPCSRAYSHDWTECPFVHPGENARRRDPRKFHYSCVPCPDFRKGSCRRGDLCEYAHGVFECWLHPAQYRTRLCKDGTTCTRRVCFFAHTQEELRPLFVSTGSAVPSPRSSVDLVGVAVGPPPGTPSSPFTPPMSPNGNVLLHHHAIMQPQLPQPAVPALHLPGSTLSRLRTSVNARDLPVDDLSMLDLETQQQQQQQLMGGAGGGGGDYSCFSPRLGMNGSSRCKAVTPANLEELFAPEVLSPRFAHESPAVYSPTHKLQHHLQQQQGRMLSPIKTTGGVFSPAVTFGPSSPVGVMSPRGVDPTGTPMGGRLSSALAQREKQLQLQQMRSLSSRDLGGGGGGGGPGSPAAAGGSSPWAVAPGTRWGSPTGKAEWAVNGEELGRMRRSGSFGELSGADEPDVSWVQSLVKESPPEGKEKADAEQTVLAAWLEQMQIDQAAAS